MDRRELAERDVARADRQHGDRNRPLVALTFDDGPNVHARVEVARILDSFGVKGTFFTVGKGPRRAARISRSSSPTANCSQTIRTTTISGAGSTRGIPSSNERRRRSAAGFGVCPPVRPPHGQHTPFMSYQLARKHMTMVGWDTSATDFATTDGRLVARAHPSSRAGGAREVSQDDGNATLSTDRSAVSSSMPSWARLIDPGRTRRRMRRATRRPSVVAKSVAECPNPPSSCACGRAGTT